MALLLAEGAILAWLFLGSTIEGLINAHSFEASAWRAGKSSEIRRTYMVDDLLKRYDLRNMPRDEVERLLGEPDDRHGIEFVGWEYRYWVGPSRSMFKIDTEVLVIRIGYGRTFDARLCED
jgi:hypothetical protein